MPGFDAQRSCIILGAALANSVHRIETHCHHQERATTVRRRQGCLGGFFELFMLNAVFDWLQDHFGFGRGPSCAGCGCGLLLLIIFILLACNIIFGTDWFRVTFLWTGAFV